MMRSRVAENREIMLQREGIELLLLNTPDGHSLEGFVVGRHLPHRRGCVVYLGGNGACARVALVVGHPTNVLIFVVLQVSIGS